MKIKLAFLELSAEKICKSMILRVVELWVSIGHVPVKVELKALNVEEIEVRKSWTVESLIKRQSCQIVLKITSVPLLKDILQKLNSTLTLETIWSTKTPQS